MSTTADTTTFVCYCVYCGRRLSSFACLTQLVFNYDGIDYCRDCSAKRADEMLGLPVRRKSHE